MEAQEVIPEPKGHWLIEVYRGDIRRDEDGNILNTRVEVLEGDNLMVTVGKQMYLDRLFGLSAVGAMTRIGVGHSTRQQRPGTRP